MKICIVSCIKKNLIQGKREICQLSILNQNFYLLKYVIFIIKLTTKIIYNAQLRSKT